MYWKHIIYINGKFYWAEEWRIQSQTVVWGVDAWMDDRGLADRDT